MRDSKIISTVRRHQDEGVLDIASRANGLVYFVDNERRGLLISGQKGMTVLSVSQAKALRDELPGILRDFLG